MGQWGLVEGDGNADAIIRDRKEGRQATEWGALLAFFAMLAAAIWYGRDPSPGGLATVIALAAIYVAAQVGLALYPVYTMLLVAERRVQLLEGQVQALLLR